MEGLHAMWLLGNNFLAGMFRTFFKKNVDYQFYMKQDFEVTPFCSSRYNDKNANMLSRLQITVTDAVNGKKPLLQFMVFILDNDLLDILDFKGIGISTLLGTWIKWLCNQVNELVLMRKDKLPLKVRCPDSPFIYWIQLPKHKCFDEKENLARNKLNICLESVVHQFTNKRVVKFKNHWDPDDSTLVCNNRITQVGLAQYWFAIDSALQFNVLKRKQFLARSFVGEDQPKKKEFGSNPNDKDRFFQKHSSANSTFDRFHWVNSKRKADGKHHGKNKRRFLLPRLDAMST